MSFHLSSCAWSETSVLYLFLRLSSPPPYRLRVHRPVADVGGVVDVRAVVVDDVPAVDVRARADHRVGVADVLEVGVVVQRQALATDLHRPRRVDLVGEVGPLEVGLLCRRPGAPTPWAVADSESVKLPVHCTPARDSGRVLAVSCRRRHAPSRRCSACSVVEAGSQSWRPCRRRTSGRRRASRSPTTCRRRHARRRSRRRARRPR